ncbi:MAG: LCP family protein, partial [Acutalibacteraceae bacterium]|nr:LCP family protein [Acutalibacteraceae bacterium]
ITESKSDDGGQNNKSTSNVTEIKSNSDEKKAEHTNNITKSKSDDGGQNNKSTSNVTEIKSNSDEKKAEYINNITESKSDDGGQKNNSTNNVTEIKSNSDEKEADHTSDITESKSDDGEQKNKSTSNATEIKSRSHKKRSHHTNNTTKVKNDTDEQKNKGNGIVNDVTDKSAGTNRHIRKRYSFSIDKEEDYIPVAVYSKRREPKKDKVTKPPKKKKKPIFKVFAGIAATVISLLLIVSITLTVLVSTGRKSLTDNNENTKVTTPKTATVEGEYVVYDGKKYKYNNKVTTILFSGIDKHTDEHDEEVFGTAGQADSIFVMALNTETGKYKLMAVSRDTMVDVNIVDVNGNFKETKKMQLCLAHAYGDGKEISNENLKASVSRVFFGIPINSYISIDIDAIYALNDAVGGVNVDVIEDLSHRDPALVKGANVTLTGRQAEIYVRARDVRGDANQNNLRMERQLSYVTSFIEQSIAMTKSDIKTPINLFNEITPYTRTDIAPSEITYLASAFLNSGFSVEENYIKVPGKAVAGEEYAEYYTDTDKFFKIILDTYYTRVE